MTAAARARAAFMPTPAENESLFAAAIAAAGLTPPREIIADGKLRRFASNGKSRDDAGWYVVYPCDVAVGMFGCWRAGIKQTWCSRERRTLSADERAAYAMHVRDGRQKAQQDLETRHAKARAKANADWAKADPADAAHPYLAHKGVGAHGIRQNGGDLLIPLCDTDGTIHGLQYINTAGDKKFPYGTAKCGHFHLIGEPGERLIIAEGYATAASIYEATSETVAVAFDKSNLLSVARTLRQKYQGIEVVIAGDNDQDGGGQACARKAATAVSGMVAICPEFKDFNDLYVARGAEAVRVSFEAAVASMGDTGDTGDKPEEPGFSASPLSGEQTGDAGDRLPRGFSLDSSGVWFEPPDEPTAPRIWICSPLGVTALTRNGASEAWGRLLEYADPDGRLHCWPCPMEMLAGDGTDFRSTLMSTGLQIAPGVKARSLLATYVQAVKVRERATCTDRIGWHDGAYVLPDETLGEANGRVLLQTSGEPPRVERSGSVEDWRQYVAALCIGNSRLVLSVSAAFAAPLLQPIGDSSGGINFVGASSIGKTVALRTAASVGGSPNTLRTWRVTANGLEGVAALHNDALLVLDELAEIDPREAGAAAYMLANGAGKGRARRDGMARPTARWRLLFLSSGEIGLADHMREAGKRARAGQEVRMADLSADAGLGHGLFESLHGHTSGAALAGALTDATRCYHGTAGRAYLDKLVGLRLEDVRRSVSDLRRDFLTEVLPADADGQVRRVADRFALIAAGGALATQLGITGWPDGEAVKAARVCFRAWLARRGGSGSQEDTQALAQVRHFFEAHGASRFGNLGDQHKLIVNRAGYKRTVDGRMQYLILPEVFKRDVCAGFDYRQVAHTLKKTGQLETESDGRLTVKPRNVGRVYAVWGDDEG